MAVGERIHDEGDEEKLAEGTLVSHLIELRQRLLRSVITIVAVFVCLLPFQDTVWSIVTKPLTDVLPETSSQASTEQQTETSGGDAPPSDASPELATEQEAGTSGAPISGPVPIATGVISPFLTPLKATFYIALFISMPVVLYQAWRFVAPGLYRRERRFAVPLMLSSIVLFYAGLAFAYFVVFGIIFAFIYQITPPNIVWVPDINLFLSFALRMSFAFGIAFEIPIATFMLIWSRLVSFRTLSKNRPYIFLGTFVVAMFMTPPDPTSQTMLALPMYALYEGGLVLSRILLRDRLKEEREAEKKDESDDGA